MSDKEWFQDPTNRGLFRTMLKTVAEKEVGYVEQPVNRTKYGKWYDMDGSAWCMPGESLVLCPEGYRRIDQIKVGDYVVGGISNQPRRVAAIASRGAVTREYRFPGARIRLTPEHPLLVKTERTFRIQKTTKKNASTSRGVVDEMRWVRAGQLAATRRVAPNTLERDMIALAAAPLGSEWNVSEDFAYLAGRYVADGHTSGSDVCISDSPDQAENLRKAIAATGATAYEVRDRTTLRFCIHSGWVKESLKVFGKASHLKTMSPALAWDRHLREAFLRGYLDGDGHLNKKGRYAITTVSPFIRVELPHLLRTLGIHCSESFVRPAGQMRIEGRLVDTKDTYCIQWSTTPPLSERTRQFEFEDDFEWVSASKYVPSEARFETVFDLKVEEDESFIANGIVVHNCAMFASWVYNQACTNLNVPNPLAGLQSAKGYAHVTSTYSAIFKSHPEWLLKKSENPLPGDLLFWDHDASPGGAGHTGMVTDFMKRVEPMVIVKTVEGNTNSVNSRTGGSVCQHTHPVRIGGTAAHGLLLGIARPSRAFYHPDGK